MRASGLDRISPGRIILADVDLVFGNDITAPVAIAALEKAGRADSVFDREKIAIVLDHFTPNKDIASAEQCLVCREFARRVGIKRFFDVGRAGIEHALLPEQGIAKSFDVIVGADSHTATHGALSAFATGVGSTDMAVAMASGKVWLRVPEQIKVVLKNRPGKYVTGKDIALRLISLLGPGGATYKTLEFVGDGVASLAMSDRFAICNMSVECGAKNGIFGYDSVTEAYEKTRAPLLRAPLFSDPDARYASTLELDLSRIRPTVAFPPLPSNARELPLSTPIKIDQVVIGSCTNGRLDDIRAAASILRGRKVADSVRLICIPATRQTYLDSMDRGYLRAIVEAGGAILPPSCGPCLGGHLGVLARGETCLSTTNRNFTGRMGDPTSEIYLASPYVAAATAIAGVISSPEEI